jgi:hypothetical protein
MLALKDGRSFWDARCMFCAIVMRRSSHEECYAVHRPTLSRIDMRGAPLGRRPP